MQNILGPEGLKELLAQLEMEIINAMIVELERIGRAVSFDELGKGFFLPTVDFFIESVSLVDHDNDFIVIDTSTSDIGMQSLATFFSDNLIEHLQAIRLLEQLKHIV